LTDSPAEAVQAPALHSATENHVIENAACFSDLNRIVTVEAVPEP
jgi:hypothetical protein